MRKAEPLRPIVVRDSDLIMFSAQLIVKYKIVSERLNELIDWNLAQKDVN